MWLLIPAPALSSTEKHVILLLHYYYVGEFIYKDLFFSVYNVYVFFTSWIGILTIDQGCGIFITSSNLRDKIYRWKLAW